MCGHLEWNRGSWNHCSSYRSNWFGNHCSIYRSNWFGNHCSIYRSNWFGNHCRPRCGSLWFHRFGHNHAHSYSHSHYHGSFKKPLLIGIGFGLASFAMNLFTGWLEDSLFRGGSSRFNGGGSWLTGGPSWYNAGSSWLGGGPSWLNANTPYLPPANPYLLVDPAKQDADPAKQDADPAKQDADPVKPDADPVKLDVDPVKLDTDPVKPDADPVKPDADSDEATLILDKINTLNITNETGYTDATKEDLANLISTDASTPSNVISACDIVGSKNRTVRDVKGDFVTVEDNGETIKLKDNGLPQIIEYQQVGVTTNGRIVYKDVTPNLGSPQYYILQKKDNEFYLMQYAGMDGSNEKAHSSSKT